MSTTRDDAPSVSLRTEKSLAVATTDVVDAGELSIVVTHYKTPESLPIA